MNILIRQALISGVLLGFTVGFIIGFAVGTRVQRGIVDAVSAVQLIR